MKKILFALLILLVGLSIAANAKSVPLHKMTQTIPGVSQPTKFSVTPLPSNDASRGGVEPEIPEGAVSLRCKLKYDADKFRPYSISAYNVYNASDEFVPQGEQTIDLTLLPGKYDIMAIFFKINPQPLHPLMAEENFVLVIMEDVDVKEGSEVDFDVALSKNRISFRPVNAEGDPIAFDHNRLLNVDTWEMENITKGNADDVVSYMNVWQKEYGLVWNMFLSLPLNFTVEESEFGSYSGHQIFDLFVNDTSDKYRFSECQVVLGKTGRSNIIALWADGNKEQTVTNNPANYMTFEPEFVRSPLADDNCVTRLTVWPKFGVETEQSRVFAQRIEVRDERLNKFDVSIPWGISNDFTDLIYLFDYSKSESDSDDMLTPYYIEHDGSLCSKFCSILTENRLIGPDVRGNYLFPGARGIEYDASTSRQTFGGNAPVCNLTYSEMNVPYDPYPAPNMMHFYLGRAGESRDIDRFNSLVMLDIDNKQVASTLDEVWDWQSQCVNSGVPSGLHHYHLENHNVIVEGLPGANITDVYLDKSQEDCWPPELRMVNFKDNNGILTDRFENASDANLCMYGGDFNMQGLDELRANGYSMIYWKYDYSDWKVEYAPYGEDIFSPLEIEEKPEYFMFPAFGAFMGANLSQVNRKSETGWYDLRITLTDKAGNSQTQLISPAFKINSYAGITVPENEVTVPVSVIGNHIECPADARIYNISGKQVSHKNLTAGVYIVACQGTAVKVVVP